MKPHPRIRKTVKWGGAVVSVILLVVWVGSVWYRPFWESPKRVIGLVQGRVMLAHFGENMRVPLPNRFGIGVVRGGSFEWWFSGSWAGPSYIVYVPLWAVAVPAGMLTAVAWRLDTLARRRARVGLCPACGYNRAGLPPQAVCPECGAAALAPPPAVS